MPEGQNNINIGNLGNIDWNKLKPGLKKENIAPELNTIWDKIDTSKDGEIDQAELDILKSELEQSIKDKNISCEEAKAFLESNGLNEVKEESLFQFILQLGNIKESEIPTEILNTAALGFVDGRLDNIKIDPRATGISYETYTGSVRIPLGQSMPEDGSLPKVLVMALPDSYGENSTIKLTYNEADGTYMPGLKDMAFKFERNENGDIIFRATDDEHLRLKRQANLEKLQNILMPKDRRTTITTDYNLDNYYGNSFQHGQGDCYLMAAINSIRNLENGQEILQNLRTETVVDGKKVYTITLPGARFAARALRKDNLENGIYITGEYSFTEEDVKNILDKAGSRYSRGDADVILLEAAFEQYRTEVAKTLDANGIHRQNNYHVAGMNTGPYPDNLLRSGMPADAVYILTGGNSEVYQTRSKKPALSVSELHVNEAKEFTPKDPSETKTDNNKTNKKNSSSNGKRVNTNGHRVITGEIKHSSEELENMLDKLQRDYDLDNKIDKIATASFRLENDTIEGLHAFTIKKVTVNDVILINPWYPDQDLVMPRKMFLEFATQVTLNTNRPLGPTLRSGMIIDTITGDNIQNYDAKKYLQIIDTLNL